MANHLHSDMMLGMRVVGVLYVLMLLPLPGTAQRLSNPSPHYGALSIPDDQIYGYLGLSLDRFTPNGKETDPGIYNGIGRTIGLNFLNYSFAAASVRWPGLVYRGTFQLGYGHDQPTETIQRKFHIATDSLPIESIDPRNNVVDAVLNFETDYWATLGPSGKGFVGAGFAFGTPNQELWLHTGGRFFGGGRKPTLSGVARLGFPLGGTAFPDSTLTDVYGVVQLAVRLPFAAWVGWRHMPDLVWALQQDTGFFADKDGAGIGEKLGTIGLHWPNEAVVFEIWNDYFGGEFKDKGPTGGARIYFRAPNWSRLLSWLP